MSAEKGKKISNPYKGLFSYTQEDKQFYFGNEIFINRLIIQIRNNRFSTLIGGKYSGKSSIVSAGLIPKINSLKNTSKERWNILNVSIDHDIKANLSKKLHGLITGNTKADPSLLIEINETLSKDNDALIKIFQKFSFEKDEKVLLILDQFEKLFDLKHSNKISEDNRNFINQLINLSTQDIIPVHILNVIQTDYLELSTIIPGLSEKINKSQVIMPPFSLTDFKNIIKNPAELVDLRIEQTLQDTIIDDLEGETFQLSKLSYTLFKLIENFEQTKKPEETIITEKYYTSISGLKLSMNHFFEKRFNALEEDQQKATEHIFKRILPLVSDANQLPQASLEELSKLTELKIEEIYELLSNFTDKENFLVESTNENIEDDLASFNNEDNINALAKVSLRNIALIEESPRLKNWIKEEELSSNIYLRLSKDCLEYKDGASSLYKDPELEIARDWMVKNKPTKQWSTRYNDNFEQSIEFLQESQRVFDQEVKEKELEQVRRIKKARIFAGTIAILSLIPIFLSIYAIKEKVKSHKSELKALKIMGLAQESRNRAIQAEQDAINLQKKTEQEKKIAYEAMFNAQKAKNQAFIAQKSAENANKIANEKAEEAKQARVEAESAKNLALRSKAEADTLRYQDQIKINVLQALRNPDLDYKDLRKIMIDTYQLNQIYNDGYESGELYLALRNAVNKSTNINLDYNNENRPTLCIAVDSVSGMVITGDEYGVIKGYRSVPSGLQEILSYKLDASIKSVALDVNKKYIFAGSEQGELFAINIQNQNNKKKVVKSKTKLPEEIINQIFVSQTDIDQNILAVTQEHIHLFKFIDDEIIYARIVEVGKNTATPFIEEGSYIVGNSNLYLYDLANKNEKPKPFIKIGKRISCISYDSLSNIIAVGCENGEVLVIDINNKSKELLHKHKSAVTGIVLNHNDGSMNIISTSYDNFLNFRKMDEKISRVSSFDINSSQGWVLASNQAKDNNYFYTIGRANDLKIWFADIDDMYKFLLKNEI
ncbi:nSTAND1 domain-containing NTPase [Aureibacter tunicatorum]|uniref:Glucan-binding YG repeat protein n=1 Tax=Aureibacter tunicatorum TaxID=866807 RepID=A0AAE3XS14_9BACT|nr:hypothetical protein [Aureibacter tunicatorum]MDR6241713.1 glucan-binding YG repeat protein [Aureibacter tunicatorum]BDD07302.1 hypothetical protein AUTU_47850 [Aureibacter tunicatorum]